MLKAAHDTLVRNIDTLMARRGLTSDAQLGKLAGVDQKTIWRIRKQEQSPTLDKLSAIASAFGLEVWQILIPGLDPSNPPVFVMSSTEQSLYNRMKRNLQEMIAAEPEHAYKVGHTQEPEYTGPERRRQRRREDD